MRLSSVPIWGGPGGDGRCCAWSSELRSSDLSSRAAPRSLSCAWFSDLRFKCLFSTFLSTSLDDFAALGANLGALGAILEPLGAHFGDFAALLCFLCGLLM